MIDFSLNLLCRERRHLLPATLDTLRAQQGAFEVLLLDGVGKLDELVFQYPELRLRVADVVGQSTAEMMNRGVELSRGKYIQFIEPGDRYLSQHGLSFLSEWIKKHGEPDMVYTHSLIEGEIAEEELTATRSPWFLKSKVLSLGGFDRHLELRPTFDLICRLQKGQTLFCPRILMDPVPKKLGMGYMRETWKILRRHYGFWQALKWVFTQDHRQTSKRVLSFLKHAFAKEDVP